MLRRADLSAIEAKARAAAPREACGLLLGRGDTQTGFTVTRVVESENVAPPEAHDRFEIEPALLLRIHRSLREAAGAAGAQASTEAERILGVYHSHPGGKPAPSAVDRARAAAPGYVWLITALDAAGKGAVETRAFRHAGGLEPARFQPLSLVLVED